MLPMFVKKSPCQSAATGDGFGALQALLEPCAAGAQCARLVFFAHICFQAVA